MGKGVFVSGSLWSCLVCCITYGCENAFSVCALRLNSEIQQIPVSTAGAQSDARQVALVRVRIAFSYLAEALA